MNFPERKDENGVCARLYILCSTGASFFELAGPDLWRALTHERRYDPTYTLLLDSLQRLIHLHIN